MKDDITLAYEDEYGRTKQEAAVEHVNPLMAAYAEATCGDSSDEGTLLVDLLADLRHWADAVGQDFDAAAATAQMHHDHESDEEETE